MDTPENLSPTEREPEATFPETLLEKLGLDTMDLSDSPDLPPPFGSVTMGSSHESEMFGSPVSAIVNEPDRPGPSSSACSTQERRSSTTTFSSTEPSKSTTPAVGTTCTSPERTDAELTRQRLSVYREIDMYRLQVMQNEGRTASSTEYTMEQQ
ncbi:hypothetical protein AAVH_37582, partial [Aphelenchoides avenae]